MKNIRETIKTIVKEESEYQAFFRKALEKTGKSIPSMSDEEKKAFFNKIDAAWDGKGEKNEGNAFGAAVVKAKEAGEDEFEVGGKTFKVESVHDETFVFDERHFGKKGIIIMIDDGGKKVSAIFKDKKNADKYNRNKQSDVEALLKIAKTKPFGKAIDESVNEAKKYDIGMGRLGNGTTVYNRAEEQYGDYKTIAHISDDGTVKYYDKSIPTNIKQMIEKHADKMKKSVTEGKKVFKVNPPIGKSKYSISSHDGVKKHKDGSDFFDINIFNNKVDMEKAIKDFKSKGFIQESKSINEGKFKVDDLVYNKKTKTVGIVRMGDDKYGEVKTDADGNVDVDDLEIYNPIKNKQHQNAKAAPSTVKEVDKRGLFNPFKNEGKLRENASRTAMEIGGLTGLNKNAVQKFVDDNNLDIEKVFQFVKKGKLSQRMDFVTAVAGKPGNPIQKKLISKLSESKNETVDEGVGSFFKNLKNSFGSALELTKAVTAANKGNIQTVKEYIASVVSKYPQEKRKEAQRHFAKLIADKTTNKPMAFLIAKMYDSTNESINENFSADDIAKIKGAVESASSFMGIGAELKKLGMKYGFSTEPLAIYMIKKGAKTFVLVNKQYADKPDFVVGNTAGGLLERKSVNEGVKISLVDPNTNKFVKTLSLDRTYKEAEGEVETLNKRLSTAQKDKGFYWKVTAINESKFKKGDVVKLTGTQYKGKSGLIVSNDMTDGNYHVQIDGTIKGIKPNDLVKESVNESNYAIGDKITVIRNDGKQYNGKVEKLNPLKIRTSPSDTIVIPTNMIKKIVKESLNETKFKSGDKVTVDYPTLTKPLIGVVSNVLKGPNGDIVVLKGNNGVWDAKFAKLIEGTSINEGKFKVDDLVYNKKTKTVGIVRIGDDKYGEVKTDADGNVNVDDLEKYNPFKFKHQSNATAAPSTQKEVNKRGLFTPFKQEAVNEGNAFGMAVTKAKKEGLKEFEFNGKKYKVKKGSYEKNEAAKKLAEKAAASVK